MGTAASWLLGKLGQVRTHQMKTKTENKGHKMPTKPRAAPLHETSFDEVFFSEDLMNNYSSKKNLDMYIKDLPWRWKWVNDVSSFFVC